MRPLQRKRGAIRALLLLLPAAFCLLLSSCGDVSSSMVIRQEETTRPTFATEAETTVGDYNGVRLRFSGQWSRTDVEKAYRASLEISSQTANTFSFSFTAFNGVTEGTAEGTARFVSDAEALYQDNGASIRFTLSGDRLEVETTNSSALPDVNGVSLEGSFTTGDPLYVNADLLDKMLTDKQRSSLRGEMGDSAYREYCSIYEDGISVSGAETPYVRKEGNVEGILYEAVIPGASKRARTLIGDNDYYYVKVDGDDAIYTDDPLNRVPDCLAPETAESTGAE